MEDRDLFAYARTRNPVTSKDAAQAMSEAILSRLQQLVLDQLKAYPAGLTVPEIAALVEIPRDTISPRIRPMIARKLVIDSGEKRVPPGHTRACIVWKIKRGES